MLGLQAKNTIRWMFVSMAIRSEGLLCLFDVFRKRTGRRSIRWRIGPPLATSFKVKTPHRDTLRRLLDQVVSLNWK